MELEIKNGRSLVRLALLGLLAEREGYGYDLARRLREIGLLDSRKNISPIYRSLKELELHGWVVSRRMEGGTGESAGRPERRLFQITSVGRTVLMSALGTLNENLRKLYGFVVRINRLCDVSENGIGISLTEQGASEGASEVPPARVRGLVDFD